MGGVGVAVDEGDGNGFDAVLVEDGEGGVDGGFVERDEDASAVVDPLLHGEAKVARDEGRGAVDPDVVLLEPVLVRHFEGVAVAFGDDQGGFGALPLDDGVGGQGGAVDDEADGRGGDGRHLQDLADGVEDPVLGGGVGGEHLGGDKAAAGLEGHVGEGAADVDGEAGAVSHLLPGAFGHLLATALSHLPAPAPCS